MRRDARGGSARPTWDQALLAFEGRLEEWERSLDAVGPLPVDYPSERTGTVVWPDAGEPIPRHLQRRARRLFLRYEAVVHRLTERRDAVGRALGAPDAGQRAVGTALFIDEFA